jgi:hypothetical protein
MTKNAIILGILAIVALARAAAAQNADLTGTWTATFEANGQTYPAKMVLKTKGATTTGTISSERGESPITGSVSGQTVTLSFTTQGDNGPIPIAMKGTVEADAMKGTFDHGDGAWIGRWSAQRGETQAKEPPKSEAPAGSVDVTGTWTVSLELPNISATPTIVLKQDGQSLTGEYQSQQYGKFPLKGTLKGNRIELEFEMSIDGNAVGVSYSGTVVDNDTMKGDVSYGGLADGTFSASRRK